MHWQEWDKLVAQGLGPKYIKHASESLMAINILVYVRLKLQKHLSSTATSHVPTGAVAVTMAGSTWHEYMNKYCCDTIQLMQLEAPKHHGVIILCYGNRGKGRGWGHRSLVASVTQCFACGSAHLFVAEQTACS